MRSASFNSRVIRQVVVCTFVSCLVYGATTDSAFAKKNARPFGGRVVAAWDNVFAALPMPVGAGTANFSGISQMKHMGRSGQVGTLHLGFPHPATGLAPGNGSVTITANNGDTVSFDYQGILNSATGEGAGTLVITGGTGRFQGATGCGTFHALIDISAPANQSMTVLLDGKILY